MAINTTVENINNQPTIQPRTVTGIFTKYIAKTLPLAFDESMSYYECLCALLEYLNETIVPDINNTNDGLSELQGFYLDLQNYVNTYFDNLDVQEEINNKLDSLVSDGTISRLLNQELLQEINNQILQNTLDIASNRTELENKVSENEPNSITMDMLTTEVRTAMTGGSTAVVGENSIDYTNIKNNGIDLLNLNDKLQSNLLKKFTNVTLENASSGYYSYNSGTNKAVLNNATSYQYYQVTLTKGTIYRICCYDAYAANGFIVIDPNNDNEVVIASNPTSVQGQRINGFYFRPNKSGLIAYISFPNSEVWGGANNQWVKTAYLLTSLSYLNDTEILIKDYDKINLIALEPYITLEGLYVDIYPHTDSTTNCKFIKTATASTYMTKVFYIQKGETYKVKSYNAYQMAGIAILDLTGNCTYISSNASQSDYVEVNREFTASEDGYMFVSYSPSHPAVYEKYVPFGEVEANKLQNKSLYADGDSVVYGDDNGGVSFVNYIAQNHNMTLTKKAVNGTTIAKRNGQSNSILERVEATANNSEYYDYIIIEGGYNDFFNSVPLGEITSGLNDTLNEYTFAGALEKICKLLVTKFSGSKFMFVLAHKKVNMYYEIQKTYWDLAEQILTKWSVPYINLSNVSGLVPITEDLLALYFNDNGSGTHPNELGFKTFYVPKVTSKMLEL